MYCAVSQSNLLAKLSEAVFLSHCWASRLARADYTMTYKHRLTDAICRVQDICKVQEAEHHQSRNTLFQERMQLRNTMV